MRIKIKKIYTGYEIFENKVLEIRDGKIFSIDNNFQKFDKNFEENIMIPGFIDNHIHGGYGYNMNGASIKELENFSEELLRDGTTSYLATLGAEVPRNISKNISTFKKYIQEENKNGAEMIGIHLEGPFLNPKFAGVQDTAKIYLPDLNLMKSWIELSENLIKIVTLAPELAGALEIIEFLSSKKIISSAGHTAASTEEIKKAFAKGLKRTTHLFNGMIGLHHRNPGVIGETLNNEDFFAEMAGFDTLSIDPSIWKMIFKLKKAEKIIITTDSGKLKGLPDGIYNEYGKSIEVKDKRIYMDYQGSKMLPGIPMKFIDCFKNFIKYTGATIEDAILSSSINPAKEIGVFERKGTIEIGKDADILLLDEKTLNLEMTITSGKLFSVN